MNTMRASLLARGIDVLRRDGLAAACVKTMRCAARSVLITNAADWYCARTSAGPTGVSLPPTARVEFDATEEVLEWLARLRERFGWVWVDGEIEVARACEHVYPLLRVDQKRAGYLKLCVSRAYIEDFGTCLRVPARTILACDVFVAPEFRGRGLATGMVVETLAWLARRRICWMWCHIPSWNRASVRTFTKCGFEKVACVRYLRFLGLPLFTRDPEKLMLRREEARIP